MDDTAKIVVGAAVGFVSAVAAEPLKQSLAEFRKRRLIPRAIDHAAWILWWELTDIIERHPDDRQLLSSSYDEIRHFIAHETTTFWSVRGSAEFKMLLDRRDQMAPGDKRAAAQALTAWIAITDRGFRCGSMVRLAQKREWSSLYPKVGRLLGWEKDSTVGG